jgi:hypothetical protein
MFGIELKRLLIAEQRLRSAVEGQEHAREMLPQFGIIGLELHRLVEDFQGFLEPSHLFRCDAKGREIFAPGIFPDHPRKPFHRVVVLAALQRQQAHQMERVGVVGLKCERLAAANLCVEWPALLQVFKAGFIKLGRRCCRVQLVRFWKTERLAWVRDSSARFNVAGST